jgi:2-desacetyl-2-hydroxyethyl bacteriochlorophyllide A dehydrogenase
MLAYVMEAPGAGSIREVPEPELGDYDALVEMLACGVCSSTDKMLRMGTFRLGVTYPSILGHESVGRIVRIGSRVRAFQIGDLVTRPSAYRPDIAAMDQYWGGFAERGVVTDWAALAADGETGERRPRGDQVVLPGHTDAQDASLAISLSETFSVIARCDVLGKTVAVVGTGVAGLSFVTYAKQLGAARVIAIGRRAERLAVATRLGADDVSLADEAGALAASLGGVDYVFEASGQAHMISASYAWVRPGGHAVVYSAPDTPAEIDLFSGPRDVSLTVASTHEADVLPRMVRMVETGAIDRDEFLTHRYPFADITRAFDDIAKGDVVKAMITFA